MRGRCAVGRCVRGRSSPLTGASCTGLGWHWQDKRSLLLQVGPGPAERAHSPAARLSAARGGRLVCHGTPKRAPELRGQLGHVGGLAGHHDGGSVDLAGGSVPSAVPAIDARAPPWLRGRSGQTGGRTATRTAAAARRAQAAVEHWPTGAHTHQGTTRSNLEWLTMPCTRPS